MLLQAFQFTASAAIKLPPLDLAAPPASPPRPSPPPGQLAGAAAGPAPAPPPPLPPPGKAGKCTAGPDCVWLATLYGRVYCCHLDKASRVLRLYRMYR